MTSIMAPWPFYQWGMDILGPLTPARGGAKFVIVAIDYFTNGVEAKPLSRQRAKEIIRFRQGAKLKPYGRNLNQVSREKAGWVGRIANRHAVLRTLMISGGGFTKKSNAHPHMNLDLLQDEGSGAIREASCKSQKGNSTTTRKYDPPQRDLGPGSSCSKE
ncbi:reverse transcriptase domain-containing protein [Tanacetum coccineum]